LRPYTAMRRIVGVIGMKNPGSQEPGFLFS
jgi:hypothetical protein